MTINGYRHRVLFTFLFLVGSASAFASAPSEPSIWMNLFVLTADLHAVNTSDLNHLIELGARGIEFPGSTAKQEDCVRLGAYVRKHKLGAALNIASFADADISSSDPEIQRRGIDYLKQKVDCAEAIGASVVAGPFVLPWGYWPQNIIGSDFRDYIEDKKQRSIPPIREVATYAARKNIRLALEPLTRWEMPGLNTLRETIDYLSAVHHPNLGVTLDISHEVLDGEGPEVFAQQVQWLANHQQIFYVQVSAPHRGDLTRSWLPWADFFAPLVKVWKGPLAIEIMNAVPPFAQPDGNGLRLVRPPFVDVFAIADQAISTTEKEWKKAISQLNP